MAYNTSIVSVTLDTEKLWDYRTVATHIPDFVDKSIYITDYKWVNDFAHARNFAFAKASATHAGWALMLDTDMHYSNDAHLLKEHLRDTDAECILLPEVSGAYYAPRLFKLPIKYKFIGKCHEWYDIPTDKRTRFDFPAFWENDKSADEIQLKLIRDKEMLRRMTTDEPTVGRWWYYLGDTLSRLGEYLAAKRAFTRCVAMSVWDEERAWSCYRMAVNYCEQERYEQAISLCSQGLAYHSGIAELCWLAGWAAYKAGNWRQAVNWELLAKVHAKGTQAYKNRIGFRNDWALTGGPDDVMGHAVDLA
jgi:tetratricopeptide (TPR) repeat protein